MTIGFQRPVGAEGDVSELEYVSALHQSGAEIRTDGSINDEDIVNFLMSRYGIDVSPEEMRKHVMQGLGGGDGCIDLMEVAAILFIPTLLKAATPTDELPNDIIQPRDEMLDYVLSMILHDTTGNRKPKPLDKRLIQRILVSYGEVDLASNDELVDEMLQVAQTDDGKLNTEAFSNGLTSDVQLYDIRNETRRSTNYDDVFLTKNHRTSLVEHDEEVGGVSRDVVDQRKSMSKSLKRKSTAQGIDMIVDTFRSKTLMVILWVAFLVSYFGYEGYRIVDEEETCPDGYEEYQYGKSWSAQSGVMVCEIAKSVVEWLLTFVIVTLYGLIFIGLGSMGNSITCKRFYLPLIAILVTLFFTVGQWMDSIVAPEGTDYLQTVSMVLGVVVSFLHLCHVIVMIIPDNWMTWTRRSFLLEHLFGNGVELAEANIKQAGAFKLNSMVTNALELAEHKDPDAVLETHFGQSLLAFSRAGKKFKQAGGFLWTWRQIFSGKAFREEGIWLSARLLASNMAQFIVSLFVLIAGIKLTQRVNEQYDVGEAKRRAGEYIAQLFNRSVSDELVEELAANYSLIMAEYLSNSTDFSETCAAGSYANVSQAGCELVGSYYTCDPQGSDDYICTLLAYSENSTTDPDGLLALGLLNASGFDADLLMETSEAALQAAADASVDSLYPAQKYMVLVPCIIGVTFAFVTAVSLAITYIPSVTSTTLQLRSGIIRTLHDGQFNRYRVATDQVTLIIGSMFWGSIFASFVVGGLVGGIVFLFLWQATVSFAQRFIAIVIGILVVMLVKLAFLIVCRIVMYKAFYRTRPASANLSALCLECANFALSVGFVFLRMCKLLITAALFVGRIDTPFLAEGVGRMGNLELDNYPTIFLKDVLSHEAHRHPYLELMGVMYLMKLRYGDHFGNRAGSTWRLVFVYALLPWLNKYRVNRRFKVDTEVIEDTVRILSVRSALGVGSDASYNYNDDSDNENEPPSSLMRQFKSLRTIRYGAQQDDDKKLPPPANMMRQSFKGKRLSGRASLLLKDLESERVDELEKEKSNLQVKVNDLHGQVSELQEEVKRIASLLQQKDESKEVVYQDVGSGEATMAATR